MLRTATTSSPKSSTARHIFDILRVLLFSVICILISYFCACFIVVSGTMPLYLKIATVNCRGIRDRAKRLAFFTHAKTLDVHVLCLQETFS